MNDSGPEALPETLAELAAQAAARWGERPAIHDGERTLSFADLDAERRRAARAFIAAGLRAGDAVAIWAPNSWQWVVAALGAQSAGGALVPLNTRFKGPEAVDILRRSASVALCVVDGFLGIDYLASLRGHTLEALKTVICLQGDGDGAVSWERFMAAGDAVPVEQAQAREAALRGSDIADIMFTSGTTGQPKGVLATHAQNLRVFDVWSRTVGLRKDDRYLIINPFFHSFGYKAGWLAALLRGCQIFPMPSFDVERAIARIATARISVLPGPPTIFQSLLAHPERQRADLSSLRLAITGAASVPVSLIRQMRETLGFDTVLTAYGLTESCGVVSICSADDSAETVANTAGRPVPGVEVRCVDDNGQALPAGEPGELWVRGYNVMRGYLNDPEATAAAIDSDGWLRTGDVAVIDRRGYLRITDRIKDMFIVGGFNCYPAEIENALCGLDGIAQAAVVGMPDARLGEVGAAFIALAPGAELDAEDVIAWCKDNMANYKVPRRVVFVDALPTNAGGKVVKPELRARLGQAPDAPARCA